MGARNTQLSIGAVGAAALALLAGALPAAALTPGDACEAAKLAEAGKYGLCRLQAESKAVKKGTAPDYTKCDAKYGTKWGKIETKGAGMCPSNGDAADIQSFIAQHTADVAVALAGGWAERFVDNADGTITDNVTRLTWEKKVALGGGTNYANRQDADNVYRWSGTCSVVTTKRCQPSAAASAACLGGVAGDPDGCAECVAGDGVCNVGSPGITIWQWLVDLNGASYGGHDDWRVPTHQELQAIIDYADSVPPAVSPVFHGASCGAPCTDITSPACSCTPSNYYWSASAFAPDLIGAWHVGFSAGDLVAGVKSSSSLHVRAVRSDS